MQPFRSALVERGAIKSKRPLVVIQTESVNTYEMFKKVILAFFLISIVETLINIQVGNDQRMPEKQSAFKSGDNSDYPSSVGPPHGQSAR